MCRSARPTMGQRRKLIASDFSVLRRGMMTQENSRCPTGFEPDEYTDICVQSDQISLVVGA